VRLGVGVGLRVGVRLGVGMVPITSSPV